MDAPPGSVWNPSFEAVPAVRLNEELISSVTQELDAVIVYPEAAFSIHAELKVAKPLDDLTVVTPFSSADEPPVSGVMESVISMNASVTVFP